MKLRNWPAWLKGGIIALIVYVPIFIYFTQLEPFNFIILEIPAFPILMLLPWDGGLTQLFFILLIYYFLIGALIGFIVGIIKKQLL